MGENYIRVRDENIRKLTENIMDNIYESYAYPMWKRCDMNEKNHVGIRTTGMQADEYYIIVLYRCRQSRARRAGPITSSYVRLTGLSRENTSRTVLWVRIYI